MGEGVEWDQVLVCRLECGLVMKLGVGVWSEGGLGSTGLGVRLVLPSASYS